jgi:hypothetical protein
MMETSDSATEEQIAADAADASSIFCKSCHRCKLKPKFIPMYAPYNVPLIPSTTEILSDLFLSGNINSQEWFYRLFFFFCSETFFFVITVFR